MKHLLLLVILCINFALSSRGQSGIDILLSPNMTFHSLHHGKKIHTASEFDSLKSIHHSHFNTGFELTYVHNINRDLLFQVGLRFNSTGFRKEVTNLQFHDSIHRDIGRIEDLSEAVSKDVLLKYNVSYLEIPLRVNYRVSSESQLYQYGIYLSGGIIAQYRVADYVNIDLTGFSVDGETQFRRKNSYVSYRNFNAGPAIGVRAVYRISKDLWVMAKPEFFIPVGSVANDDIRYRLYQFSGNVGLNYTID